MRLVDIDECNKELFYKQVGGKDSLISAESFFEMLEALPVVEKITCKDCKYWHKYEHTETYGYCPEINNDEVSDFFCGNAERRR